MEAVVDPAGRLRFERVRVERLAREKSAARMAPLDYAALVYLSLPLVAFFAGFVIWLIALPALVVITTSLRRLRPERIEIGRSEIIQSLWVALLAALFLWACGYLPPLGRTWDWFRHFAMVNELVRHAWPPVNEETHTFLRYTVAYYLFPAISGRVLGERVIEAAFFLETWIGLWLILMLLLAKIRPARPASFLVIFLFFGGLTLVGSLLSGSASPLLTSKEWWVPGWLFAYESNATLFLWVPQHAIPGLIGILLLLPTEGRSVPSAGLGLLGAAVLLWSPFAALGLLPFAFVVAMRDWRRALSDPGNILCTFVLVLPLIVYLQAGADGISHEFSWNRPGFTIGIYLEFVLLQVGVFIIALAFTGFRHLRFPAVVIAMLLALPLYRVGLFNDFTMRACIPAVGLVAIAVATTLSEASWRRGTGLRVLPLAVLFAVGAAGATLEIVVGGMQDRIPSAPQSLRTGIWRDAPFFVQFNAPLPNWVLR